MKLNREAPARGGGAADGGDSGPLDLSKRMTDLVRELLGLGRGDSPDDDPFDPLDWRRRDESDRRRDDDHDFESRWRRDPKPAKKKRKFKSVELDDSALGIALGELTEALWATVVDQYDDSHGVPDAIASYTSLLGELRREYPHNDTATRMAKHAGEFREALLRHGVEYKDLEALGLSMTRGQLGAYQAVQAKLGYLIALFDELKKNRPLELRENEVRELAHDLRQILEAQPPPEDHERLIGRSFYERSPGPLSKRYLREAHPSADPTESADWQALAGDVRQHNLDDLLLNRRLAPYANVLLHETRRPRTELTPDGDPLPITEAEPELEIVDEFDQIEHFYRDGAPIELELLKTLSGDMLKNGYREEREVANPRRPRPHRVTLLVYDVSGSMSEQSKYVLRNGLMNAYLDISQREVASGEASHTVYLMAFDGHTHSPERISGLAQAQAAFERLRHLSAGGGNSTSLTNALVDAYKLIARHQREGGELQRANVLLLTDGESPIHQEAVQSARDEIDPGVDVVLNAISMGDPSEGLRGLVEYQGGEGPGRLGTVSYRFIPYDQLRALLDVRGETERLIEDARFASAAREKVVPIRSLIELKNGLASLRFQRDQPNSADLLARDRLLTALDQELSDESALEAPENPLSAWLARATRSAIGAKLSVTARLRLWERFVRLQARAAGVSEDHVLDVVPPAHRRALREWLAR